MWVGEGGRAFTPQEAAEAVGVSPGLLQEWVVAFREEGPSGEAIRRALCGSGQGALSTSADVRPRLAPSDGSAAGSKKRVRPSKG
jgi:transposase-like protein